MLHERASPSPARASLVALIAAFAVCTAVIVFSWPDPNARKPATGPKLAECCEVKIANSGPVPRRAPVPPALLGGPSRATDGQAKVVPASVR